MPKTAPGAWFLGAGSREGSPNTLAVRSNVTLEDALLINDFLSSNVAAEPVPEIFNHVFPKDIFLVSAWSGSTVEETRRVFFLLRKEGTGIRELERSRGWLGDWILRPTFFVGSDRILIVAELGSEEYGGLQGFEFTPNRLRYLGPISVGTKIPGEDSFASPLGNASAEYSNSTYHLTFRGELFDTTQQSPKRIARRGESAKFTLKGARFVFVGAQRQ